MASAGIKAKEYDVIVAGAGNAGLCAAISAAESGATVLLIEKAPKEERGGNTKYTVFLRFTHDDLNDVLKLVPDMTDEEKAQADIKPYTSDMYYNDFMIMTQGKCDPEMAEITVNKSRSTIDWLNKLGVKFQLNYPLVMRRPGKLFWQPGSCVQPKNGGEGLLKSEFEIAEAKGVEIAYASALRRLTVDSTARVNGVVVRTSRGLEEIKARKGVILACGGFEASAEMRAKYMGSGWDTMKVRGTRYNTGEGLNMAMDIGAKTTGEWSGAHAIQVDLQAPAHDGGESTFRSVYQIGIIVNQKGQRFVDEGENFWLYTYARYGREVLKQPNAWACQIYSKRDIPLLDPHYAIGTPPVTADTIEELAEKLGIEPKALVKTVTDFNNAVSDAEFNPAKLDGKKTIGIEPPKSNWAQKFEPPYVAYPVTTGITFTFGGLQINKNAQVLDTSDNPIPGLYATGEIHGFFYYNYPGAAGLMRGSIFGRIAGAHAMGKNIP